MSSAGTPDVTKAHEVGETVIVEETGGGRFQAQVTSGSSTFLVDEPVSQGGLGSGPNPYDLLSAALGACTAMTIRLYAEHKKWPVTHVRVNVTHHRQTLAARDVFSREIVVDGPLDAEQKAKILEMAERCPVHVTLDRGSDVRTTLVHNPGGEATSLGEHMKTMTEATQA